jgi:hypothetical protein
LASNSRQFQTQAHERFMLGVSHRFHIRAPDRIGNREKTKTAARGLFGVCARGVPMTYTARGIRGGLVPTSSAPLEANGNESTSSWGACRRKRQRFISALHSGSLRP